MNTMDSGAGSLRAALLSGDSVIDFSIPTSDPGYNSTTKVYTISPASALPGIFSSVLIDGTSQSGYSTAGHPVIQISGNGAGSSDGLYVGAGSATIKALDINQFADAAIALFGAGAVITGDYLGTDPTGTTALPNGSGLYVSSSTNTIGGTTTAATNVISGNSGDGVDIFDSGNLVEGNFIGAKFGGTVALANAGDGIYIAGATNTIGGTTTAAANVISGNSYYGVDIEGAGTTGNVVEGNFIGAGAAGISAVPNAFGVSIGSGAATNTIGGTTVAAANLISGNSGFGVVISGTGTSGNVVEGNFIGSNAAASTNLGNNNDGVYINGGATTNTIGGTTAAAANVIAANLQYGVQIDGSGTSDNVVEGNFIGTNSAGNSSIGNHNDGVFISDGATTNTIGGTTAAAANVISENTANGVGIYASGTSSNVVEGNFIGTNAGGTIALGNGNDGVYINNAATGNTVDGGNLISGNVKAGVQIDGIGTTGNIVENNLIGVNVADSAALPNGVDIQVSGGASTNTITANTQLASGNWTELSYTSHGGGTMLLLPNGTIMTQGINGVTSSWDQLTSDAIGSYLDGNWSSLASMSIPRLYDGSVVLPNGEVMVYGGEYTNSGPADRVNSGEIYNPATNAWSPIQTIPASLNPGNQFGDNSLELLTNGTVLAGYIDGPQTFIFTPGANGNYVNGTWSAGPNKIDPGVSGFVETSDEETWVKLPGAAGNILDYDIWASLNQSPGYAEYFNTATNAWVATGSVPVALSNTNEDELGPALLLPNGDVFQIGANGTFGGTSTNTALYNPSTNSWTAGPVIPNTMTADDAAAAILPDGNVVFAADSSSETSSSTDYHPPTALFEYNPTSNTITQLTLPPILTTQLTNSSSTPTRMLMLPDGQLAFTGPTGDLWLYTDGGTANSTWRPTITDISNVSGNTYLLTGMQLNGLDEGASYGDDAQMAENYPIVQLENAAGTVYYATTSNWSTTAVATGSAPVSTEFTLPSGLPYGTYSLTVIANGIASTPTTLTVNAPPSLLGLPVVNGSSAVINIMSATGNGTTATITTSTPHGFWVGELVTVTGVTPGGSGGLAGAVTVAAVPSATSFQFASTFSGTGTLGSATVTASLAGAQRSMVDSIVYNFTAPVNLTSAAFTVSVVIDNTSTGDKVGVQPTLNVAAVPFTNEWVVTFTDPTNNSVIGHSIANGAYSISINPSMVTSVTGGQVLTAGETDTFYRLYGDVTGVQSVKNVDANAFNRAWGNAYYSAGFDAALDYNDDGKYTNIDANAFNRAFNRRYQVTTTI